MVIGYIFGSTDPIPKILSLTKSEIIHERHRPFYSDWTKNLVKNNSIF